MFAACLAAGTVAIAGCGSGAHFADKPRPPTPIDLSVYVNDARVSVSPASVGAGPIIFDVTNSASKTESIMIEPSGGAGPAKASTGPINPGTTSQVQVNLQTGTYVVASEPVSSSDAQLTHRNRIAPATLRIGAERANADNALLQP